jgi:NitT/TauT family transport system substrate-binding protein
MNAGAPITILAGLHLGCFEIFGTNEIRTLADLKGRTAGTARVRRGSLHFRTAWMAALHPLPSLVAISGDGL